MKRGPFRIDRFGRALSRRRTVHFTFDGREYAALEGDTVASALLANGVSTVARSFKFHRPRGVFSAGFEEPNALIDVGVDERMTPSVRATEQTVSKDLQVGAQGGWPSLRWDVLRALDAFPSLWAAGFYNKTFKWPAWHTYEGLVRRMAGHARAPERPDSSRYDTQNVHAEVLVIGGGIAGLRAALEAARSGARVLLVEAAAELGGRAAWHIQQIDELESPSWIAEARRSLEAHRTVRVLSRTTAISFHEQGVVTLLERVGEQASTPAEAPRERYWIARFERVVLATGAVEQPLVFCNNDRPGIMLAGAAHRYLLDYGIVLGHRMVVTTNNDSAYALAAALAAAGAAPAAIVDSRRKIPNALREAMQRESIPLILGALPIDSGGFTHLKQVDIGSLSADGSQISSVQRICCDALAVSGGWNASLQLFSQAGGKLGYDESTRSLLPTARHPVVEVKLSEAIAAQREAGPRVSPVGRTRRQWVDLRHDVTVADLELAVRENFTSIEHVKRYTTVGMSLDQGKTSSVLAIEILARLRSQPAASLGHTTFRPPVVPVTLGAIAGRTHGALFAPWRESPIHECHLGHGAEFQDYGDWRRPAVYRRNSETREAAIKREIRAARAAVVLCDSSSLGKIEIQGPDAGAFLEHFYINRITNLKPGRVRYALMLRETGSLFDDGTVCALAPNHYLLTTTSGNAHRVLAWLEEWHQCEWPHLRLAIIPVTEQWATLSLSGPRARDLLSQLDGDIDVSPASFPHLSLRTGRLEGEPARVYRVSFTGELGFEINVPAGAGMKLWRRLAELGARYGLEPIGVEALLQLRLEKGFIHIGSDTDATTVPDDVGFGKLAAVKPGDFIGRRSLSLPEHVRSDRLQLVGLLGTEPIEIGSHLRLADSTAATDGWVTSAGLHSETQQPIALGLLRAGRSRVGREVQVHDFGKVTHVKVVELPFLDPAGERMNG